MSRTLATVCLASLVARLSPSNSVHTLQIKFPPKASGQYHSVKGTGVESVGNPTGAASWQQSGKEEYDSGEANTDSAQARGYVEDTMTESRGRRMSLSVLSMQI